jgi:FixJ family two-component response regulator
MQDLLKAVRAAIDQDRVSRLGREELTELQQRFSRLTPRERQVLQYSCAAPSRCLDCLRAFEVEPHKRIT